MRSAAQVAEQQQILTRFADGIVRSRWRGGWRGADVTQQQVQAPELAPELED